MISRCFCCFVWSSICFKIIVTRYTSGFFPTYTCNHSCYTIYVRVFSHVYLQSFLLHDIRASFRHVYLRSFLLCGVFIPKYMTIFLQTRIYMRTKKVTNWPGHRKSSYKRHRIIPSAQNPFMYDGAEKLLLFQSSMAPLAALISSNVWLLFIALTVVLVVGSPTTDLLELVDCLLRDCVRNFTNSDRNNDRFS